MTYVCKQIEDVQFLEKLEMANIEQYPWEDNGYRPTANAKLGWNENGIFIQLEAVEEKLRATWNEHNEPVFEDSCLEFFLQPFPDEDERYFNFEVNCFGAMLVGLRKERPKKEVISEDVIKTFNIKTEIENGKNGHRWTVSFFVPMSFIENHFEGKRIEKGHKMKGKFYKCGDLTIYPHYGCWNPIALEKPNFHCTAFFGEILVD